MAGFNTFSTRNDQLLPLHGFLIQRHEVLLQNPVQVVLPIIECIKQIHDSGRAHGAVCAQRIQLTADGVLDTTRFTDKDSQAHKLSAQETFSYYPEGPGTTLEEQQERDILALANVLHLIILGHEPPPSLLNTGNRRWGTPIQAPWPPLFLQYAEALFTHGVQAGQDPLATLLQSLRAAVPDEGGSTSDDVASPGQAPELAPPPEVVDFTPGEKSQPEPRPSSVDDASESPAIPQPSEDVSAEPPETNPAPTVRATLRGAIIPPFPIRLPNGTVGRDYSASLLTALESNQLSFAEVAAAAAENLPKGLSCEASVLSGVPAESGEFSFPLMCSSAEAEPGKPSSLSKTFLLTINPDPASLWKNIASDKSVPFWKPDERAEALPDSPLLVSGASRRGRSHAHVGSCRDDDFAMAWLPVTGWYALVVADGAGSAKYSREGSRIACEQVHQYFSDLLADTGKDSITPLVEAFAAEPASVESRTKVRNEIYQHFGSVAIHARKLIEDKAAAENAIAKDFHTTLIIVLARPLAAGGWFVASFSIGDGAAALVGVPDDAECLLTSPDGGEFAGQTTFLTVKEALSSGEAIMKRIKFAIVPSFDALILVTDGVSDPRFPSDAALADAAAWRKLWTEVKPLVEIASTRAESAERLLDWMNFSSPGHHDDRTIIVLTETQPSASS